MIYLVKLAKVMAWVAVAAWMVVIFNFSAQSGPESGRVSQEVTEVIVETIEKVVPEAQFEPVDLHRKVRKGAHFINFMILGIFVSNALLVSKWGGWRKRALLAFLIAFCYALFDEGHQYFVPGRGAQFSDVLVDTMGAAVGITIYLGLAAIFGKCRLKKRI